MQNKRKGAHEMTEEAKKARNEYMKKYRAEHKERLAEQDKARRLADPERYKEYCRKYWEKKAQGACV